MEYCPDCVVQMKKENKHQLGKFSVWLVCPKCGYRTRPENEGWEITKNIEKKMKERKEKYKQNLYNEEGEE